MLLPSCFIRLHKHRKFEYSLLMEPVLESSYWRQKCCFEDPNLFSILAEELIPEMIMCNIIIFNQLFFLEITFFGYV